MKKLTISLLTACILLASSPIQLIASNPVPMTVRTETPEPNASTALVDRLNEIKAMDKSNLSRNEKKALRKEVKSIKHKLQKDKKQLNGGVYISATALVIILLLIIIL